MFITLIREKEFIHQKILLMLEIKKVCEKGIYLFSGNCSGNSSLIEDEEESKFFIESASARFSDYMSIKAYKIDQESWSFYCKLKSKEDIQKAYLDNRRKSKKAKKECVLTDTWRIISEQVRHFLSRFVKFVNVKRGRKGSLRMESYKRFILESEQEGLALIDKMKQRQVNSGQENEKYKSMKSHWKFSKQCGNEGYLRSFRALELGMWELIGAGAFDLVELSKDVVRQYINSTIKLHKQLFKQ